MMPYGSMALLDTESRNFYEAITWKLILCWLGIDKIIRNAFLYLVVLLSTVKGQ